MGKAGTTPNTTTLIPTGCVCSLGLKLQLKIDLPLRGTGRGYGAGKEQHSHRAGWKTECRSEALADITQDGQKAPQFPARTGTREHQGAGDSTAHQRDQCLPALLSTQHSGPAPSGHHKAPLPLLQPEASSRSHLFSWRPGLFPVLSLDEASKKNKRFHSLVQ